MFNINLKSNFLFSQAALPEIRKRKGAIVIMSSIRGLLGQENGLAYAASKAGQIGLAKSLANDEAKNGVRVNAICPSNVVTPLMQNWLAQLPNAAEVRARSEKEQALGRMADIMEIGRVCAFLASDDASFVTGLAIPVDGGMLLR